MIICRKVTRATRAYLNSSWCAGLSCFSHDGVKNLCLIPLFEISHISIAAFVWLHIQLGGGGGVQIFRCRFSHRWGSEFHILCQPSDNSSLGGVEPIKMQKQVEQTVFRAAATLLNLFSPSHPPTVEYSPGVAPARRSIVPLWQWTCCFDRGILFIGSSYHSTQVSSEITRPPQRQGGVWASAGKWRADPGRLERSVALRVSLTTRRGSAHPGLHLHMKSLSLFIFRVDSSSLRESAVLGAAPGFICSPLK